MTKQKVLKQLIQLILFVVIAIFIVALLQYLLFMPVGVIGPSMEPTIDSSGSTAYVLKSGYTLQVDDIVIFYRPMNTEAEEMPNPANKPFDLREFLTNFLRLKGSNNTDNGSEYPPSGDINFICVIKRVVGAPGDTIEIRDTVLYRNGEVVDDFPMSSKNIFTGKGVQDIEEFTVPEGEYFVMGDNRDNSYDSEDYGCIKDDWILGKVVMIVARANGFGIKFY